MLKVKFSHLKLKKTISSIHQKLSSLTLKSTIFFLYFSKNLREINFLTNDIY